MYPDSPYVTRVIFKIYHHIANAIWRQMHWQFLLRYHAPQDIIAPVNKTIKGFYEVEKKIYRSSHYVVRHGEPLIKRDYYIYKVIAEKYGWPYIKETYDKS